jgi:DNA-binding beta-propeller fold protein YncE
MRQAPGRLRWRILAASLSLALTLLAMAAAAFHTAGTVAPLPTSVYTVPGAGTSPSQTPLQPVGPAETGGSGNIHTQQDGINSNSDGATLKHKVGDKKKSSAKGRKKKKRSKSHKSAKAKKESPGSALSAAGPAQDSTNFYPYLYVLDVSGADQVLYWDLRTDDEGPAVVLTQGLGVALTDPVAMDLPDDGSFLAVVNLGFRFENQFAPPHITIIDTAQRRIVDRILLPERRRPSGVTVTPDGKFAYVSAFDSVEGSIYPSAAWVLVVDLTRRQIIREIRLPDATDGRARIPGKMVMTPDGALVFTLCLRDFGFGSLCVVDTLTNTLATVITDRSLATVTEIAMHPNGSRIYAAPAQNFPEDFRMRGIAVIDTSAGLVSGLIPVSAEATSNVAISVTPDGQHLVYTNQQVRALLEIETEANQVVFQTEFGLFGSESSVAFPLPPEFHEK